MHRELVTTRSVSQGHNEDWKGTIQRQNKGDKYLTGVQWKIRLNRATATQECAVITSWAICICCGSNPDFLKYIILLPNSFAKYI